VQYRLGALILAGWSALLVSQTSSTKVFTGARLIDGTSRAPVENAAIVVRDGRIVGAGPAAEISIPADAERVALGGKTIIPGLINTHGHVNDVARDLSVYAAYGVTTVQSLGGEGAAHLAARDAQNTPAQSRTRMLLAGPVIAAATAADAREAVARNAAAKVDIIKIRVDDNLGTTPKMTPEVYRAVIDEAHKRGLRVAAHIFYLADARDLLESGADFIAHSVRDAEIDRRTIDLLVSRGVCYTPTLMREVSTFIYKIEPPFFSDPLFLKHADPQQVARFTDPAQREAMRQSPAAGRYEAGFEIAKTNLKKLSDAGVTIAMGTDSGGGLPGRFVGYFELLELEIMAGAGLTPQQVLRSATADAARCLKVDKDLGTIEPGKWADFVVLNTNPLTGQLNPRAIDSVWIAGNRVAR
jgi:imidazolonepropionase-like amidohydrolase